ncbi:MAG: hypothetical protein ABIO39_09595 [Caulobacteraceae bacterium]
MAAPHDPRANQKERTRAAIVEAAARLVKSGQTPSVADAAKAAKVSRATAYRYFPIPDALLMEVAGITPAYAPVEAFVQAIDGGDAMQRLVQFAERVNATTFADEAQMRLALKVYQDIWFAGLSAGAQPPPLREGRRMRWLEKVLEPERKGMAKQQWRRLQAALALTMGVEAMVVMKDVCRLDDEEAGEILRWAAQAILKAGLDQPKAADKPRPARERPR